VNADPVAEFASVNRRGDQNPDRRQKEQARLQPGTSSVVFLYVVPEATEQKRHAQHEQRVGNDRPRDGGLHQGILPRAQRGQRNDEFRQVSKRCVEQAAHRIARLGRNGFRGVAEQSGERHDGQDRQYEQQRVSLRLERLPGEQHGYEDQQPEEGIVADLFQQGIHGQLRKDDPSRSGSPKFSCWAICTLIQVKGKSRLPADAHCVHAFSIFR
jgi:hypothetical protein